MTSFRGLLFLGLAMTGLACANGIGPLEEISAASAQAEKVTKEPVQLAFLDSRIFDEELSGSMSGGSSRITVEAPAGFTLNKIPERFDRWLYSVKEGGGKVVATPENPSKTRGLVSAVIDVIVSIVEKIDEIRLYEPSQQYNATLLYREDGSVKNVVFERRTDTP